MLCVTITTVVFCVDQMRVNSSAMRSRVNASSDPNGSSSSKTVGLWMNARAMATRCSMPPDKPCGYDSSKPVKPDEIDQGLCPLLNFGRRQTFHFQRQTHVVAHGAPRHEVGLLEHDADRGAGRGDELSVEPHAALLRLESTRPDAQQRRFAAARRPDDAHELAGLDFKGDVVERIDLAVLIIVHVARRARRARRLELTDFTSSTN